jgi:hypothetical protein
MSLAVLRVSKPYSRPGKLGESRGRKATELTVRRGPTLAGLPAEVLTYVADRVLLVPDASLGLA